MGNEQQYLRLYNSVNFCHGTQKELDEIISIVHSDFPNTKINDILSLIRTLNGASKEEALDRVFKTANELVKMVRELDGDNPPSPTTTIVSNGAISVTNTQTP